ncbi:MAG: flavin reductase family protein [Elusimicrobia bacterium]|nr:flavin reductase family protein [Elusimicrobiota bacterium]
MNLNALSKISYGMFVISSKKNNKFNGQIANTVFQVSAQPPMIAISINKQNLTHKYISESKVFTAAVLSEETPMKYIGLFGFKSGINTDKFKECESKIGVTGARIATDYAVAYFEAEVVGSLDAQTHTIFTGKIVASEIISEKEPMTYAYYHKIKGGLSPKTAPTYIVNQQ